VFDDAYAFDRAVKKAIKDSGREPGAAYRQMLRDRFLCRVFSRSDHFILKGGSGMLARMADSRATRDVDLALSGSGTAVSALEELKALASLDLDDWCRFILDRYEEALDDNGYSRLLKLRFSTHIGEQEKDPILIDLSLDCTITDTPQRVIPKNRVHLEGIITAEYLLYPVVDQIADKLCAIIELHEGRPSSRTKDLVDLVLLALDESYEGEKLQIAIGAELVRRNLKHDVELAIPTLWRNTYSKMAELTFIPLKYQDFDAACELVQTIFNPVLAGSVSDKCWDPKNLSWVTQSHD
jgi:hypothetical protein